MVVPELAQLWVTAAARPRSSVGATVRISVVRHSAYAIIQGVLSNHFISILFILYNDNIIHIYVTYTFQIRHIELYLKLSGDLNILAEQQSNDTSF